MTTRDRARALARDLAHHVMGPRVDYCTVVFGGTRHDDDCDRGTKRIADAIADALEDHAREAREAVEGEWRAEVRRVDEMRDAEATIEVERDAALQRAAEATAAADAGFAAVEAMSKDVTAALQRAEAAEEERDEAVNLLRMYWGDSPAPCREPTCDGECQDELVRKFLARHPAPSPAPSTTPRTGEP